MSGLAILCPGQGAQHPAMLALALGSPEGARVVGEASDVLGRDAAALVAAGGPDLFRNALAQPLLCAAELATWAALREALPRPVLFAGYSLGELIAYGCAGALHAPDAIALAVERAAAMDRASAGAGASGLVGLRGLTVARVEALAAAAGAHVAIVNGPDHCVVGGAVGSLARVEEAALAAGATQAKRLPIEVAAHTAALAPAVAPFAAALARAPLRDPPIPVLAGIDGSLVRTRGDAIAALSRQLAERIEWARCLAAAAELGCRVFLELGPGVALTKMASEVVPGAAARSVCDFRSLGGVAAWVDRALVAR